MQITSAHKSWARTSHMASPNYKEPRRTVLPGDQRERIGNIWGIALRVTAALPYKRNPELDLQAHLSSGLMTNRWEHLSHSWISSLSSGSQSPALHLKGLPALWGTKGGLNSRNRTLSFSTDCALAVVEGSSLSNISGKDEQHFSCLHWRSTVFLLDNFQELLSSCPQGSHLLWVDDAHLSGQRWVSQFRLRSVPPIAPSGILPARLAAA